MADIEQINGLWEWILWFMAFLVEKFYWIAHDWGLAIILFTIVFRLILMPLMLGQTRSSFMMQKVQPQLKEIQTRFEGDPVRIQEETQKLYAEAKFNPLASCIPMLIQMPIFMGLFFVLGRAIELRGMPAFLWITDLSQSDVVWSGFSIPFVMPSGLAILPWIMVVTTYFQTKVTMTGSAGMDPAQQKMMTWMMPAMMFFFSAVMPSGLVLYWIVSNFWSIAQYKIINRGVVPAAGSSKLNGKNVQDAKIVK